MEAIQIQTRKQVEMIDITRRVNQIVKNNKIKQGLCIVFTPHTTAGITINENADPSVTQDILTQLHRVVPIDNNYLHMEGNAAAHIKSTLVGCSQTILVEGEALQLGTWQSVFLCEFDGPRDRKVWVQLISAVEIQR